MRYTASQTTAQIARATRTAGCRPRGNAAGAESLPHWSQWPHQSREAR
ncbi:hypothetical protein HMPREF0591_6171 [Mycobacterium parascrofulaceum ATCC BAA-614]|uniref:Uncharacterized protein n=1 Tax=Mycobacterium parascrofulaceum ATCC BAA-614 TaxID=525368 RepID=D5PJ27_9MYCO|nr:hypothetical protein HMPREF0591_6171 [Mycobacterium parascrofulaceum ATCC BAA-614]